jgi:hypothetical protein
MTKGLAQRKEITNGKEEEQGAGLYNKVLNKNDHRVGSGQQMDAFKEPGITNGSYTH